MPHSVSEARGRLLAQLPSASHSRGTAICCASLFVWQCMSFSNTKQLRDSMQKWRGDHSIDVANIKYGCLRNEGHSVRFLNRFGKLINHRIEYQTRFSLLDAY